LQPARFGKAAETQKMGFAQLTLFLDTQQHDADMAVASLYSYQSLMLFRIIRQLPLKLCRCPNYYALSYVGIRNYGRPSLRRAERPQSGCSLLRLQKISQVIYASTLRVKSDVLAEHAAKKQYS